MTNYLQMTQKELDINTVMDKLIKTELTIAEAAKRINKTERHVKRFTNGKRENNKVDEILLIIN